MVVMQLLQQGTDNGMFGHPAGNSFSLVSSICGSLSEDAYCCVITRNGFLPQVLKDMRITTEDSSFSHGEIDKNTINLRKSANDTKGCGVSSCNQIGQPHGRLVRMSETRQSFPGRHR